MAFSSHFGADVADGSQEHPAEPQRSAWSAKITFAMQSQSVHNVAHGIVFVDVTDDTAQVNPAAACILDMPAGPCARDAFLSRLDALRLRCSNAPAIAVEMSRILANPESRLEKWLWCVTDPFSHLHLSLAPLAADGRYGQVWVFYDVSELYDALHIVQKLEHRLNRLLTEGDVIAFRLRRGGAFEWVSRSTLRMMGFEESTYLGRNATEFCHPEDTPLFVETVKILRATGRSQQIGFRVRDNFGQMRSLEGRVFLAHDDQESLEVIMSDVTSHVELQQLRARVTSAASHELRTPLAFMTNGLELLEDGTIDVSTETGREVVDRMHMAARRLARMSGDLLGLQTLEITRTAVANTPVAIFEIVHRAALTVAPERGVRVVTHDDTNAAMCYVDGDLLQQAVINLVSNAIRYSPDDSTVDVGVAVADAQVVVTVHDRGPGIPEESRSIIFQPFVRLNGDRSGAGLGLAIVHRIAQLHRGSIAVTSPNDGPGSVFTLVLHDLGGWS